MSIALSRLSIARTALFICDIQEKFTPLIYKFDCVLSKSMLLLQASNIMGFPKIISEQYPTALGSTNSQILSSLSTDYFIYPKKKFSMMTTECTAHFQSLKRDQILLCGIEAHICVSQTALDLLASGYQVHIICDAVSSQRPEDRTVALARLRSAGAVITTAEAALFDLMGGADYELFKDISKIVKAHNQLIHPDGEFGGNSII